jgi:hypothetical protein
MRACPQWAAAIPPPFCLTLTDLVQPCFQVNVYKLGGTYLQLTRQLRLADHPALSRPTDPSLYLRRFVVRLLGEVSDRLVGVAGGR